MYILPIRKMLAAVIASALLLPATGFSLDLGEIEVESALNQKLDADIELLSTQPDEVENIIVKLASRKEFESAGLDRPLSLNDLRFKAKVVDGVAYIKVTSSKPVREPSLDFLIEIDWPNGYLLREYTILLDPSVFLTESIPAVSVQSSTPVPAVSVVSTSQTFTPAPVVQQQTLAKQVTQLRVKSGDTGWKLAESIRPRESVSISQTLMALLQKNPEAFTNGNVNGIKRGYILRAPDITEINAISYNEAKSMLREHSVLWLAYQQAKKVGKSVASVSVSKKTITTLDEVEKPSEDKSVANPSVSKKITTTLDEVEKPPEDKSVASPSVSKKTITTLDEVEKLPEDKSVANPSVSKKITTTLSEVEKPSEDKFVASNDKARLSIVAGNGTSTGAGKSPDEMSIEELRVELTLAKERIETERVEKEVLKQRLNVLENIGSAESLLTIDSDRLAEFQSSESSPGVVTDEAVQSTEVETAETEVAAVTENNEETSMEGGAEEAIINNKPPLAPPGPYTSTALSNEIIDKDAVSADEVVNEKDKAFGLQQEATVRTVSAESNVFGKKPESEGPLAHLLNNPTSFAVAGGGLLLIVALIALVIRRRKEAEQLPVTPFMNSTNDFESVTDDIADDITEVTSIDGEVEEASQNDELVVTDEAMVQSAVIEDKASEARDDIISEADVYLAYDIYQQAEELLTQAIKNHPEVDRYRLKLAEIYFISKNTDSFIEVATDIKQRVDDKSPDWIKITEMGQSLCPDDSMFLVEAPSVKTEEDEVEFDFFSREDGDEISTKLDLARAYLDMGDNDGTRDILDEVLLDGDDEQKQEAAELMKKLS